jgi:6-phosphogluconate dehydrogenase
VFARVLSSVRDERVAASKKLPGPTPGRRRDRKELVAAVHDALWASKVCAYAQGFDLMTRAGAVHGWKLDFATIARIWRGGCIIRARLLQHIADAYSGDSAPSNLLLDPYFRKKMRDVQDRWRRVVALAATSGLAAPGFTSALAYYDGYRTARLPANLLQAQRDYFGAHSYERVDRRRGQHFHLDWLDPARPQHKV